MIEDFDRCYRAIQARDARFDGWFYSAVTTTRIYCRPSCPATTPRRANVTFFSTAAVAQAAGFRACMRCRPDVSPGSPEWTGRSDVVARAVRLIADGVVDRGGVGALAAAVGYSPRQLHRLVVAELGAGPLALARTERARTARILLGTSELPVTQVAFAAGFSSVRQFNDTVRDVFAMTPTQLRARSRTGRSAGGSESANPGAIHLRLYHRLPCDSKMLLGFLGARAVPGLESFDGSTYRRSLRLARGSGVVELSPDDGHIRATMHLDDLRDLTSAVSRCRRLLDLDADPVAIDEALGGDSLLGPMVAAHPGRRLPGTVDSEELAVRAVAGQQISVSGARSVLGRIVSSLGRSLARPDPPVTHSFPEPAELADAAPEAFAMPAARRGALQRLASALASGDLRLGPGADPSEARQRLAALRGIGPWTISYVAMRALGDPDVFLPTDLGIRRVVGETGRATDPVSLETFAERWRPWRSYATAHLWSAPAPARGVNNSQKGRCA